MKHFFLTAAAVLMLAGCGIDPDKFAQHKYREGDTVRIVGTDLTATITRLYWRDGWYQVKYFDHAGVRHYIYIKEDEIRPQ